ncbi:MAG: tRNA (adenosine(37)-N6)-threonylcarbamoyltransferase complex dimerization subunit type 1 TsaB [Methylococcales bacterium]|nr:tRNA (adenosine(37)-N6)-threonylcarbamoyltransferase complex dimerization subunit type 1 TsaB [Methylococcales bacterium]
MKLLAVETATEACSAALSIDGVISERFELAPRHHTKLILPMIDELMREAGLKPTELDALAFGCGPGSFTGIRIATGVIQGLAFGLDLPVVRVSTLAAMAQDFFDRSDYSFAFTAMDARMEEIFWGVYQRNALGFAELIGNEAVIPAELVDCPIADSGVGIGSAWGIYADKLISRLAGRVSHYESDNLPRAALIARLGVQGFTQGLAVPVELAMPVYLRDKVAKTEAERRSGVQ